MKGDRPIDRYLGRANDVPLPSDEDDYDDYLEKLDPLAKDYIDEF
jgi:hypothetical protein